MIRLPDHMFCHMTATFRLQRDNDQLRETLALREREHQLTISKLQQAHEEKVKKIRDQYVDLTASILKLKDRDRDSGSSGVVGSGPGGAGAGGTTSGGSTSSKSSKYVNMEFELEYCLSGSVSLVPNTFFL